MRDPVCLMDIGLRDAGAMAVHHGRAWYFCSDGCKQEFIADPDSYRGNASAERLTVGVMGSAGIDSDPAVAQRARTLGEAIADNGLILITGDCKGIDIIEIKRFECLLNASPQTIMFKVVTIGMGGRCKTVWYLDTLTGQDTEHFTQRCILPADKRNIIDTEFIKTAYVFKVGHGH